MAAAARGVCAVVGCVSTLFSSLEWGGGQSESSLLLLLLLLLLAH